VVVVVVAVAVVVVAAAAPIIIIIIITCPITVRTSGSRGSGDLRLWSASNIRCLKPYS
jgi:hypothetical protein